MAALTSQLVETSVTIELAQELVIKFSYGYLSCGEHHRLGKMTSPADVSCPESWACIWMTGISSFKAIEP